MTILKNETGNGDLNIFQSDKVPMLSEVEKFLETKEWKAADDCCNQILLSNPRRAEAYVGKLLAELHCCNVKDLEEQAQSFENNQNYRKAISYASQPLKMALRKSNEYLVMRNERIRLENIYNGAIKEMRLADTQEKYYAAANMFGHIEEYKDAKENREECLKLATNARLQEDIDREKYQAQAKKRLGYILGFVMCVCIILIILYVMATADI